MREVVQSTNTVFTSELEAARFLLDESTTLLLEHSVDFVVVGGWPAYLFHSARYGHPGTFDVDLLVNSVSLEDGSFDAASDALLERRYLRAPKNRFQAHRILNADGEDLVFHVDFLNERDPGDSLEMISGTGKLKSIYTPAMRAVFDYGNFRTRPELPGVRFPSPETYVVTKAAAAAIKKRNRDAFDIFATVSDQPSEEFSSRWKELVRRDGLFQDANELLLQTVHEGDAIDKIFEVLRRNRDYRDDVHSAPSIADVKKTFAFLIK
jgi:hypothetical protein